MLSVGKKKKAKQKELPSASNGSNSSSNREKSTIRKKQNVKDKMSKNYKK